MYAENFKKGGYTKLYFIATMKKKVAIATYVTTVVSVHSYIFNEQVCSIRTCTAIYTHACIHIYTKTLVDAYVMITNFWLYVCIQ